MRVFIYSSARHYSSYENSSLTPTNESNVSQQVTRLCVFQRRITCSSRLFERQDQPAVEARCSAALLEMGQEFSQEEEENSSARPRDEGEPQSEEEAFENLSAYRVMKVFQGSPSSRSGLSPFEDFIVALNSILVNSDNASLAKVLRENEGKEVALVVWNCIDSKRRNVALRPVKWNGPGLLGAAVRFEPLRGAADSVQRVMDVLPDSPADDVGLVPFTDFIVGTPAEAFRKEGDFSKPISEALQRSAAASFMVYSTATSRTRNIEITPNKDWGGEGSLGCELATGLLHRITRST